MGRAARDGAGVAHDAPGDGRRAAAAHWAGDAVPEAVGRLRAHVGAFVSDLGTADTLVQDVRLAVSEALSNAVIHAYPADACGRLDVRASTDPATGLLTLSVRDYGIGCRPRADSPGMGRGIAIMAALARTIQIASPADGGTELRLTFAMPSCSWEREAALPAETGARGKPRKTLEAAGRP